MLIIVHTNNIYVYKYYLNDSENHVVYNNLCEKILSESYKFRLYLLTYYIYYTKNRHIFNSMLGYCHLVRFDSSYNCLS